MDIIQAGIEHLEKIKKIVHTTIQEVYPSYYPKGAVEFFAEHHTEESIKADILSGRVYFTEDEGRIVGTATVRENEICRLFVLPQHQRKGYGRQLLEFAENLILEKEDTIVLDASLPAKEIYIRRGYQETEYHKLETGGGDYLCYDVMVKKGTRKTAPGERINYEGRVFMTLQNTENGEVGERTIFHYHQEGKHIWADYAGGDIVKGYLIGFADENGCLEFSYQHSNINGNLRMGQCQSRPQILADGLLKMHETWKWMNGDYSEGCSQLLEIKPSFGY